MNADSKVTAQILLNGAQEILGMEMVQKVIERLSSQPVSAKNGSLRDLPSTQAAPYLRVLEEIYGEPGGRGLALRIGRAAFRYGLKQFGEQAGFHSMEYRLQPVPRRLMNGLQILARIIAEKSGSKITVTDEGAYWLWRMDRGASTGGAAKNDQWAGGQDCFLIAGLLQEFAAWAGGGRFYRVVEAECWTSGSQACVFHIEKRPLD